MTDAGAVVPLEGCGKVGREREEKKASVRSGDKTNEGEGHVMNPTERTSTKKGLFDMRLREGVESKWRYNLKKELQSQRWSWKSPHHPEGR